MPSHAIPRGPEGRAQRAEARLRRRGQWRNQFPVFCILMTGLQVVGWPSATGSAGHQILGLIGSAIGGAIFTVAFMLVLMPVVLRADTLRQTQTAPRPRWQYLMIAAGWMATAGGLMAASLTIGRFHFGPGWLMRACAGVAVWFAVFGLGMLGRAVCWGRARILFWWLRPLWIPDTAATWLTPPPVPVRLRGRRSEPDRRE